MKDIFEFNHIDKKLSEENVKTLKDLQTLSKKVLVFQKII